MITLTTGQTDTLHTMCNPRKQILVTFRAAKNYDQVMQLVAYGLLDETTNSPRYEKTRKEVLEQDGEELHVFALTDIGYRMFAKPYSRSIQ